VHLKEVFARIGLGPFACNLGSQNELSDLISGWRNLITHAPILGDGYTWPNRVQESDRHSRKKPQISDIRLSAHSVQKVTLRRFPVVMTEFRTGAVTDLSVLPVLTAHCGWTIADVPTPHLVRTCRHKTGRLRDLPGRFHAFKYAGAGNLYRMDILLNGSFKIRLTYQGLAYGGIYIAYILRASPLFTRERV